MITDLTALVSNNQAITGTTVSTDQIDLRPTGTVYGASAPLARDIGRGEAVPMRVTVTETFNNLTSLTITVETDDNAAFASPKTVWTSIAYPLADLTVGARILLPDRIPLGTDERFFRLRYTVAGTAPTTGRVTAGVVASGQTNAGG